MSNIHKHRNLADQVVDYLAGRPGVPHESYKLAKQFDSTTHNMRATLEALVREGRIAVLRNTDKRCFGVPTAEQKAAREAPLKVRPFRPYKMPQQMVNHLARIRAERDAIPSHYAPTGSR